MRNAKRTICLLLVLVMLLSILPASAFAAEVVASGYCGGEGDGKNLTWTLDSEGTLTISGSGAMKDWQSSRYVPWDSNRTFIKQVIIGDSVTTIGGFAFFNCKSLTMVTIPDSVTTIEDGAFSYCYNLTSVTIPDSVTTIRGRAFVECSGLTAATIPDGVSDISSSMFRGCTSLIAVTIPDSVTAIWNWAFGYCDSLTAVTIPDSVTTISYWAFRYCDSLTDVYFEGDAPSVFPANSNQLSFDKTVTLYYIPGTTGWTDSSAYDAAAGTWNGYKLATWGGDSGLPGVPSQPDLSKTGTFRYKAMCGVTDYDYQYEDSWFRNSTTAYNHDLAKMSLRVGLAAYRTGPSLYSDPIAGGSEYIQVLMQEELGFDHLDVYYPSPTRDTIGYAIGSKTIASGDQSLILVAVRGGGYEAEWASNFTIGSGGLIDGSAGDYHVGFDSSAAQVEQALAAYIRNGKAHGYLKDDCVVWITSYSRGAAVSNMLAKRLDDGNIAGLGTHNVFAYCFACPQNSKASDLAAGRYNNIMNIINPLDFVPMVAMSAWGYGRYGQNLYLPYEEGVDNYGELKYEMQQEYKKILAAGTATNTASQATTQVPGQKDMTEGLMDWLANEFRSPTMYTKLYQESLVSTVEAICLKDWHWFNNTVKALPMLAKLGLITSESMLPDSIEDLFDMQTNVKATMTLSLFAAGMMDSGKFSQTPVSYTHYPELYLAWMDSLTGDQIRKVDNTYRKVLVNCPVNISVYDASDVLVGSIVDGVVQEIENGISVYIDEDGQFVLSLPNTEEYRIDMEATGEGTVTYTVTEQNVEGGMPERVVSYPLMEVACGDTLVGQVEDIQEEEIVEYSLTLNDSEQTAAVDLQGEDVVVYNVDCNVEGNGTVEGEGTAVYGEYKKLTAMAGEEDAFLGWYDGSTLLSDDTEYRFCVQKHTELTAKFTSNTKIGHCGGELEGENLSWELTKNGTLTISGIGKMADYSAETPAPWSAYSSDMNHVVIGAGVSGIGENAFAQCGKMQTVRSYAAWDDLTIGSGNASLLEATRYLLTAWGEQNEMALVMDDPIKVHVDTDTACSALVAVYDAQGKFITCKMQEIAAGTDDWTPDLKGLDLSACKVQVTLLTNETDENPWAPMCTPVQMLVEPET